ncbi:MAG: SHOCT domain-containing protein [Paenibacillaceae bacterium]
MKKLFIISILSMLFVLSFSFIAYAKPKNIDVVMSEIRQEQGLKSDGEINVDKVSVSKLESLGDSVMEAMVGNSEVHEQMDKNMGGDGSATLTAMHKKIGYNYLVGYPNGMMNLMSGGMMGNYGGGMMGNNGYGMMGNNGYGMMGSFGWGGITMGILFVILIGIILFFVIKTTRGTGSRLTNETPLDILKIRYAKGEISKDDFDKMKQAL